MHLPGTVAIYNGEGQYLDLGNGREVALSKAEGTGVGLFANMIVSDLYEEGY